MKLATLSTEQKKLLERFSDAGGIVVFILFECDENTSDYETHRKAVILGFKELQRHVHVIVIIL